jgi:AraC family transcriptional regulator
MSASTASSLATDAVAPGDAQAHKWVHHVIALLDAAPHQLDHQQTAHGTSHISGHVLVADLCALVRLSEAHFSRAFRRTIGMPPHAFVIMRRVELAAQYMLQTEAPLSEIALQCGYIDQPHLCKHFRQITGHTPAAWRRSQN